MLELLIDSDADALYLWLDDTARAEEAEEVEDGVILHFDSQGVTIGVEVLDVSKRLAEGSLSRLRFRVDDREAAISLAQTAQAATSTK